MDRLGHFSANAIFLWTLFMLSCSCGPSAQERFEPLYRVAITVQSSTSSGISYPNFNALINKLETEIAVANTKINTSKQKSMVEAYANLLNIYKDSLMLWQWKVEHSGFGFIKMNAVGDEEWWCPKWVPNIVSKYDLATKEWASFGQVLYPEEAIQAIWKNAAKETGIANGLYLEVIK